MKLKPIKKSNKMRINCSQPYWVYSKHIKTYCFKENKTLSSKFQCFVEFESAYRNAGTIKLNSRLTNRAWKNKDKIFMSGFDLVFINGISIRHVTEEIVTMKKPNNIEKHITIDSFANIYSTTINTSIKDDNVDELNRPRYSPSKKLLCGSFSKSKGSRLVQKHLNAFKKSFNTNKFYSRIKDIRQNMRNRLLNIIGSNDESKIYLLAPTNCSSKVYSIFVNMFNKQVEDICYLKGIPLEVTFMPCETIIKTVQEYKTKANEYSKENHYGFEFKNPNEVKASDIINAGILNIHKDFYIILKKRGKFTSCNLKNTHQNDDGATKQETHTLSIEEARLLYKKQRLEQEQRQLEYLSKIEFPRKIVVPTLKEMSISLRAMDDQLLRNGSITQEETFTEEGIYRTWKSTLEARIQEYVIEFKRLNRDKPDFHERYFKSDNLYEDNESAFV